MKLIQLIMILRGWWRSGLSSTISLLSLTIGIICSSTLLLFTITEFRKAKSFGSDENVYFIEVPAVFKDGYSKMIDDNIPYLLAEKYPEVELWGFIDAMKGTWNGEKNDDKNPFVAGVTPSVAKMLNIKMAEGSLDDILSSPDKIAITREYANQLFPNQNPIGQTLSGTTREGYTMGNDSDGYTSMTRKHNLTVAGILDDMSNSFIRMRGICRTPENFNDSCLYGNFSGLIRLKEGVNPDEFVKKVSADSILQPSRATKIRLSPLSETYFNYRTDEFAWTMFRSQNKDTLQIGLAIALAVLLIAIFNYINITLIRAPRRLKNLAGQRIMGASRKSVNLQIMSDTAINVIIALVMSAIFMQPCLNLFNSFMNSSLSVMDFISPPNLPYILGLLILLIMLPSLSLMVKFAIRRPLDVFKNPRGTKVHINQTLIIVQLIVSVVLITFSLNAGRQMEYVSNTIAESSQMLYIENRNYGNDTRNKALYDRLRNSAFTTSIIPGTLKPGSSMSDHFGFTCLKLPVHPEYFSVLGIPIIEGRVFDDVKNNEINNIVVNEAFVKAMNIKGDPIGYEYRYYSDKNRIVGVCKDFPTSDVKSKVMPTMYFLPYSEGNGGYCNILLRYTGDRDKTIAEVNDIIKTTLPDVSANVKVQTIKDIYKDMNPEIKRLKIMVEFFVLVSIFLTVMGMFGLSWYTVERRRKEIALRKIHGASISRVIGILCRSFFIWTLIATIVALPLGYYISGYWLSGFVYHIDNSILTLLFTATVIAAITFVTVIFQAWRAASANPAITIKAE